MTAHDHHMGGRVASEDWTEVEAIIRSTLREQIAVGTIPKNPLPKQGAFNFGQGWAVPFDGSYESMLQAG
ncbi:MAG: hypothetical protein NTU66_04800 [Elusimicrobia bacterium]|nr:hypothetical protein [Elusimicrobiota bacterium]